MIAEARIFSLAEVNQLIPELETKMRTLKSKIDLYLKKHDDLFFSELLAEAEHQAGKKETPFANESEIQRLEASIDHFEEDIEAIRGMGCFIRSVEPGYVDFRGRVNDVSVYFSWKLGEKEIQFYRDSQAEDSERKPLQS